MLLFPAPDTEIAWIPFRAALNWPQQPPCVCHLGAVCISFSSPFRRLTFLFSFFPQPHMLEAPKTKRQKKKRKSFLRSRGSLEELHSSLAFGLWRSCGARGLSAVLLPPLYFLFCVDFLQVYSWRTQADCNTCQTKTIITSAAVWGWFFFFYSIPHHQHNPVVVPPFSSKTTPLNPVFTSCS